MVSENLEHPTKKTKVYIPCWKTICDFIAGDKSYEHYLSVRVFFEYLSSQASKGVSIQYREKPVVACRSFPVENCLYDLFYKEYDKEKNESLLRALGLIFSTLTHMDYRSKLPIQASVIELALILNDEFDIEIVIISNDSKINNVKEQLKQEYSDRDFNCFKIMNTTEWLKSENSESEVLEALRKVI